MKPVERVPGNSETAHPIRLNEEIWPELKKRVYPVTQTDFRAGHLRFMRKHGMIPDSIRVTQDFHLTLSEAVWLKITLFLMQNDFDPFHMRGFKASFFSRFYSQRNGESDAAFHRRADRGEGVTGLDQLLHFAYSEKQDVLLQFSKEPQLGIVSSFGKKGNLTSSTFYTVSLISLVNEVMGEEVLTVRENRVGHITSAEEEFILASRDYRFDEVLLTRNSKDGKGYWDLMTARKGTAGGQELHQLLEETRLGYGELRLIGQGGKQAVYRLENKKRLH